MVIPAATENQQRLAGIASPDSVGTPLIIAGLTASTMTSAFSTAMRVSPLRFHTSCAAMRLTSSSGLHHDAVVSLDEPP